MNIRLRKVMLCLGVFSSIPGVVACTAQTSTSKGIENADGLAQKVGNGEIVVFYANETPRNEMMAGLYGRISNAVMAAQQDPSLGMTEKATLARIQRSYAEDLDKFSAQVEKDARGLEAQICGEANAHRKTGLFIFTNRLARSGKVRFCLPGHYAGSVEEGEFNAGLTPAEAQDFRYAEMPLASEKSFMNAFEFIRVTMMAKNIAHSDMAYVLISKSHGGGDYVIAPKLSYRLDLLNDAALYQRYVKIASSVSVHDRRVVDLVLDNGQRLADVMAGGVRLEDIIVPDPKGNDRGLKLGDLKLGDLDLGADGHAWVAGLKFGDLKIGDLKIGDLKTGDLKIGDLKIGDLKTGDLKTGDLKLGDLKLGDLKLGDLKLGDLKTSDLKLGDLKNDLSAEMVTLDAPGVTKQGMTSILKGMELAFSLVFFESCDSDLGADLTDDLLFGDYVSGATGGVGSVYFSDREGLKYETVNYGAIQPSGKSFSASLKNLLDAQRRR